MKPKVTVFEGIMQAIARQRLAPGMKLNEEAIGEVFGVSRTKVRAALLQLAARGLVTIGNKAHRAGGHALGQGGARRLCRAQAGGAGRGGRDRPLGDARAAADPAPLPQGRAPRPHLRRPHRGDAAGGRIPCRAGTPRLERLVHRDRREDGRPDILDCRALPGAVVAGLRARRARGDHRRDREGATRRRRPRRCASISPASRAACCSTKP